MERTERGSLATEAGGGGEGEFVSGLGGAMGAMAEVLAAVIDGKK